MVHGYKVIFPHALSKAGDGWACEPGVTCEAFFAKAGLEASFYFRDDNGKFISRRCFAGLLVCWELH